MWVCTFVGMSSYMCGYVHIMIFWICTHVGMYMICGYVLMCICGYVCMMCGYVICGHVQYTCGYTHVGMYMCWYVLTIMFTAELFLSCEEGNLAMVKKLLPHVRSALNEFLGNKKDNLLMW